MAALNFPNTPSISQVHTENGRSWIWDGASWLASNLGGITALLAGYLPLSGGTMSGNINMGNQALLAAKTVTFNGEVDDGSIAGGTYALNFATGIYHKAVLASNFTLTLSPPTGPAICHVKLFQDATGSRIMTLVGGIWPADYLTSDRTLSTNSGALDILVAKWDGSNWEYTLSKNWS